MKGLTGGVAAWALRKGGDLRASLVKGWAGEAVTLGSSECADSNGRAGPRDGQEGGLPWALQQEGGAKKAGPATYAAGAVHSPWGDGKCALWSYCFGR